MKLNMNNLIRNGSFSLAILWATLVLSDEGTQTDYHEHVKALKDFVPDHPHLHNLVDKIHTGDLDAKYKFERESLLARFAKVRERLPADTDEAHVVLHFLDDYTHHVTGGHGEHSIMDMKPLLTLLEKEKEVRCRLVDLGKLVQSGECDFTCLSDTITKFMNDSLEKIMTHIEL